MNVMMATATSPTQTSVSSNDSSSADSSFLNVLGGLLSDQSPKSELKKMDGDKPSGIENILNLLRQAGIALSKEGLESEEAMELISLLPIEWQQDLLDLVSKLDSEELLCSELQNILLGLLTVVENQSKLVGENEPILHQLKQSILKLFPQMDLSGKTAQQILEEVTKLIDEKVAANPRGQMSGQAFIDLFAAKVNTNVTLPGTSFIQLPTDGTSQGLNISQTGQELGQAMSRAEQAVIHLGDKLPKDVQQQQFLRQFQSILQRGSLTQPSQGMTTLSIKLYPEHLGRVDIQLTQIDGSIVAKIIASSSASRELIETQLAQLRHAFTQQQIPVERIEVASPFVGKENEEQETTQQGQDDKEDDQDKEEKQQFQDFLNELTFNERV